MQIPCGPSTMCTFCTRTSTSKKDEVTSDKNWSPHQKRQRLKVAVYQRGVAEVGYTKQLAG